MIDPDMGSWAMLTTIADRLDASTDAKGTNVQALLQRSVGTAAIEGNLQRLESFYSRGDHHLCLRFQRRRFRIHGYNGQLFKITDREGTERFSYDVRGRVLKSTRYLTSHRTDLYHELHL